MAVWPTVPGAVFSLGFLALGEIIQAPRYYEYIAKLAPPGQQGTYMGFAFLPIGIGSIIGGWFGGRMDGSAAASCTSLPKWRTSRSGSGG